MCAQFLEISLLKNNLQGKSVFLKIYAFKNNKHLRVMRGLHFVLDFIYIDLYIYMFISNELAACNLDR